MEMDYHDAAMASFIDELNMEYYMDYDLNYKTDYASPFKNCFYLSIYESAKHLCPIVLASFVFTIFKLFSYKNKQLNLINLAINGIILAYFYQRNILLYFGVLVFVVYPIICSKYRQENAKLWNFIIFFICAVHLFAGQIYMDKELWFSIRGTEMILIMKIVSLVFDLDNGNKLTSNDFDLLNYLNYLSSFSTVIFGPWISFHDYLNCLSSRNKSNINTFLSYLKYLFYSCVCLVISNCGITYLESIIGKNNIIITSILEAASFRYSNYFICLFIQSIYILNQIKLHDKMVETKGTKIKEANQEEFKVVRVGKIEMPRSLAQVVINWNIPMHLWLKKYVFNQAKYKFGIFASICLTYAISSILHGLDPNISLVLISIGFFAFAEYAFRAKISKLTNSCIQSRECKVYCGHKFKKDQTFVKAVNISFTILNVYLLSYLGQIAYSSTENLNGLNLMDSLEKWRCTYYSGHLISVLLFISSKFI